MRSPKQAEALKAEFIFEKLTTVVKINYIYKISRYSCIKSDMDSHPKAFPTTLSVKVPHVCFGTVILTATF